MTYKLKISSQNQVTLPVEMLKSLGLESGQHLIIFKDLDGEYKLSSQEIILNDLAGSVVVSPDSLDMDINEAIYQGKVKYFNQRYKHPEQYHNFSASNTSIPLIAEKTSKYKTNNTKKSPKK